MPSKVYTTKDTVPPSTAGTGTVTTSGAKFTTSADNQLVVGDYIYNASGEWRIVTRVDSATEGFLASSFTSDLSGAALKIIKKNDTKVVSVGIAADQSAAVPIVFNDGTSATLASASSNNYNADHLAGEFVKPIEVDGATGSGTVLYNTKGKDY
jgi:hypothetical protein